MLLKIVQAGDPVLRETARPLTPAEITSGEIQQLIELMRETMRDAPGVGLAAPQIGLPLQLAVIEDPAEVEVSERKRRSPSTSSSTRASPWATRRSTSSKGALSIEGFQAVVSRARTAHVEALDHHGAPVKIDARGWYARILPARDRSPERNALHRSHADPHLRERPQRPRHMGGIPIPRATGQLRA